ncbi:MAG: S8 family serine peptidase, partial [Dinghuibacter sp.]|nr:S8 family serine peptidase [Dinghuibacter sp.]
DDRYGWGYLTGKDGKAVTQDSDEGLRVYHRYKTKYAGKEIDEKKLIPVEQREYRMWKKAQGFIEGATEGIDINRQYGFLKSVSEADSILVKAMGKPIYNGHQLDSFVPNNNAEKKAKNMIFDILKRNNVLDATGQDLIANIKFFINDSETKLRNVQTPPKNYRLEVTGDDEYNFSARNYGSPDVMGQRPDHGTHVGGIVGAVRNNGKGIDGVADNVLLMPLLVVPDGDEHDKDIALGIRYAVDNGAKVVNMSFGKSFSPGKQWIDDAVEYAQKKGVLLVHAAGNEAKDLDADGNDSYPNQRLINGKWATNWITVGASGDPKLGTIAAPFSNYGKKNVDVFAPGMSIYSTLPGGNVYGFNQGTSMAAPVVSGIAALLKSYFPALTPEQLKMIIEKSVVVPDYKTPKPGAGEGEAMVNLADLSKTGGIVNAYNAVKMAYEMTAGKKTSGPKAKPSKGK